MKIERMMIVSITDQSAVNPPDPEVFETGPEIAWAFDREPAMLYVRRHPGKSLQLMDEMADILVLDDGTMHRLMQSAPLSLVAERAEAKAAVFARLSPEERALLEV